MKSSYKILQESLNVDTLIVNLRSRFDSFTDKRAKNSSISLTDILMNAYAIFSLKYSSLLQKKHLSTVMAYLILLAFHNDQLVQRCSKTFQATWKMTKTKPRLWVTLRAVFMVKPFQNFKELYDYMACMYQIKIE